MSYKKRMVAFSHWKIYMKNKNEIMEYVEKFKTIYKPFDRDILEVFILPDFISFHFIFENLKDTGIEVGVQDIFWEDYGSYTGEVSPVMVRSFGGRYACMGHSERKRLFFETNENINRKITACYRDGLVPLLLIGETLDEREKNMTKKVLRDQLTTCLNNISKDNVKKLILIYEPIWAIGQENSASLSTIEESHYIVRELLSDIYDENTSKEMRLLYGGSVNTDNAKNIVSIPEVDGVGSTRGALDPVNFMSIIRTVEAEAKKR